MTKKIGVVGALRRRHLAPASGPAHGDLVYNGGTTIACPRIHATFWGPGWVAQSHPAQADRLIQFLKDLVASDWMNIQSQYGAGTGKKRRETVVLCRDSVPAFIFCYEKTFNLRKGFIWLPRK